MVSVLAAYNTIKFSPLSTGSKVMQLAGTIYSVKPVKFCGGVKGFIFLYNFSKVSDARDGCELVHKAYM